MPSLTKIAWSLSTCSWESLLLLCFPCDSLQCDFKANNGTSPLRRTSLYFCGVSRVCLTLLFEAGLNCSVFVAFSCFSLVAGPISMWPLSHTVVSWISPPPAGNSAFSPVPVTELDVQIVCCKIYSLVTLMSPTKSHLPQSHVSNTGRQSPRGHLRISLLYPVPQPKGKQWLKVKGADLSSSSACRRREGLNRWAGQRQDLSPSVDSTLPIAMCAFLAGKPADHTWPRLLQEALQAWRGMRMKWHSEEAVLQIEKSLPPLSNHLSFNLSLLFAVL